MNRDRALILFVALTVCVAALAQTGTQSQTGTSQTGTQPSTGAQQTSPGMQQPTTPSTSQGGMSQSSSSQGMSQMGGGTEQQIRMLEEQLRQSALRNDPSFIDQHGTSDYVSIGAGGRQMGKSEVVQSLRSGDIHYQSIEPIGTPTVRIFGDSAIVNGEAAVRLTSFGQPISGNFRYTRVWVRQGGDWKIASFESTPEQPPSR
ncbi:MAG: hypothetical protein JWO13_2345 [Acidobacteriales bacterium]|nr:hypothetical protein [Terriglobales bacterium]